MDDPLADGTPPGPEELALEYLQSCAAGGLPELEPWLARLPDEAARAEFRELIESLQRAERALPRAPRALGREQLVAGRYLLAQPLGVGGMGQVWEARDRELGRRVALKFLDSASQGRPLREELFRKESRLLASLQHPGIVAVHEFGHDGDLNYIVMDLVQGRSLSEVIDEVRGQFLARGEQPLPREAAELERAIRAPLGEGRVDLLAGGDWFRAVARIELELARTLEAAHGAHVVHRDLKPSNVMLTGGGNPVVLDFGLAGSSEGVHGAVTQGLYGSVAYLAPEQASSRTVGADPRTDVYQLGLVLYEMLTLQRAFPGTAIGDVLERIQHGRFPVPRKVHKLVPRELQAICLRALELDPAQRYGSARELREDLERWLLGHELPRAVHAGRTRRALRRLRWHVRQRPWLSGAAGLVLASSIWWTLARPEAPLVTRTVPVRFEHESGSLVYLTDEDRSVAPEDWLGFRIDSNKPVHVWAFSTFKPRDGLERVIPRRAIRPGELPRSAGRWALELPVGNADVLGTGISANPNPNEGLVLLVADGPRPYIEQWMQDLETFQRQTGTRGVEWNEARQLGVDSVFSRGDPDSGITPQEAERMRQAFANAPGPSGPRWIEIEGVQTHQVECASR
jgi:serine/threonine protein kinase